MQSATLTAKPVAAADHNDTVVRRFTIMTSIWAIVRMAIGAITVFLMGACVAAFAGLGSHKSRGELGSFLYANHCVECHGANGRGHGLIAPYLKAEVPDLTLIAARAGGTFPTERVFRMIDGQSDEKFTDGRHMPIWGYEFFGQKADDRAAHDRSVQRINRLVMYLRSIQCTRDCGERP